MNTYIKKKRDIVVRKIIRAIYPIIKKEFNNIENENFQKLLGKIGANALIIPPFYIKGGKYIKIGQNFYAGPGLRIEAWDNYQGINYSPEISIGDGVWLNFYVHIGAINKIVIGDNVLIGSHVLITDHQHGDLSSKVMIDTYKNSPLYSKGPVIIDDNVWIGEGVCIMPGVHIGKNAVIGANAVVTKDVLQGQVIGGVPAKVIFEMTDNIN